MYDALFFGDFRTMDANRPHAQAVAVQGDKIVWVGQKAEAEELKAHETIDFGSHVVLPGFVDAHIHPILGAEFTRGVDLSQVTSTVQLEKALQDAAEHQSESDGEWIFGWGLDPTIITGRNINAVDIDAAVTDRPVFIRLFDAHSGVINTHAIELVGLTGTETFRSSAEVEVTDNGEPTGFLKEWDALQHVLNAAPRIPFEARLKLFLEVLERMANEGLTGGQVLDRTEGMLDLVKAAEEQGDLPIRLTFSPWIMPGDDNTIITEVMELQGAKGERWNVKGVKLMIDGTIDNGTAWLSSPDVNQQSTRPLWLDPESYRKVLLLLDQQGIRTTTHAIGDKAVEYVLDVIAETTQPHVDSHDEPGHRIEHIETLPDRLVHRFVQTGTAASMQPRHCTMFCAADGSDNWSQRLGDDRRKNAWRLNSIYQTGAVMAIGSDWPVAPSDPLKIIAEGELRRQVDQPNAEPVVPKEAMQRDALIASYTSDRARSWGDTDQGVIAPGKIADFSVFDQDIFKIDANELPKTNVVATVIGGTVRHTRSRI